MAKLFLDVLNLSITASWLIFAVFIFRFVLKRFVPKWTLCLVWALVGIRLVIPFSFESELSLVPSRETFNPDALFYSEESFFTEEYSQTYEESIFVSSPAEQNTSSPPVTLEPFRPSKPSAPKDFIDSGFDGIDKTVNPLIQNAVSENEQKNIKNEQKWLDIAGFVWILGIAAMFLYAAVNYIILKRRVAVFIPEGNIRKSENVDSPFILGIFRPKIYLPFGLSEEDESNIIAHEKAHLSRGDHLVKPFSFLILSFYWFNPLCWVAYILLCRDIELACDEKVVKDMDADARKSYATALLHCGAKRKIISACPVAFGEIGVKARVVNALNYKKPLFWIIVVSIICISALAVFFLTNPTEDDISSETSAEEASSEESEESDISQESLPSSESLDESSEESSEVIDESSEVIDESSVIIDESSVIIDESSEVIDESSEVIDESSEVIDESSEVIDESSEVIDESSEVIDESSEIIDESSKVIDESSEVIDESSEVINDNNSEPESDEPENPTFDTTPRNIPFAEHTFEDVSNPYNQSFYDIFNSGISVVDSKPTLDTVLNLYALYAPAESGLRHGEFYEFLNSLSESFFEERAIIIILDFRPTLGYAFDLTNVNADENGITLSYSYSISDGEHPTAIQLSFIIAEVLKEDIAGCPSFKTNKLKIEPEPPESPMKNDSHQTPDEFEVSYGISVDTFKVYVKASDLEIEEYGGGAADAIIDESGLKIWVCDIDGNKLDYLYTNKDGIALFLLAEGEYKFAFEGNGKYASAMTKGSYDIGIEITYPRKKNEVTIYTFREIYNNKLKIYVTDFDSGMPIKDVICLVGEGHSLGGRTDKNGIATCPPTMSFYTGDIYMLTSFSHDDYDYYECREITLRDNELHVQLKKKEYYPIKLTLMDNKTGLPIENAFVKIGEHGDDTAIETTSTGEDGVVLGVTSSNDIQTQAPIEILFTVKHPVYGYEVVIRYYSSGVDWSRLENINLLYDFSELPYYSGILSTEPISKEQ